MKVTCTICGGSHPKWDCTKPQKKSTAARKDVPLATAEDGRHLISNEKCQDKWEGASHRPAGTQALPVDTRQDSEAVERTRLQISSLKGVAGSNPAPVSNIPKPKIGRPKTGFDRTEYQKLYMRDKATIKRLGLEMTVAAYRKSKET